MIQKRNFPAGSEWRKWDPHIHTKGTLKNDQFISSTFEEFCITFFKKAIENDIAAIGITDYFSVDNFMKIIEYVENVDSVKVFSEKEKEIIKKIFIFPNIELRMLPATDSGKLVNIHILVNPFYVNKLENDLFGSVEIDSGTERNYKMNKQGIIDFGKSQNSSLENEEAYILGINTYYISPKDLLDLRKNKEFKENTIIAVSNSSQDGASGFREHYSSFENVLESSLDAVRKSIYCISDCIFSGNEKDISYFSGKSKDDEKEVIKKCGSLKPCIHGSDAHTEEKLFAPNQNRYCWVKADLTFEGFKQILFEPQPGERVCIGPVQPDIKDDYKTIRKIIFKDTNDFPETIEFNKNLNSIIGSRSSGKSALLAYLADCVDSKQARKQKKHGPGDGFSWEEVDFECEVEWCNGKTCNENPGSVVYIPQNYLYRISQDPQEIKEKIKPVLFNKLPEIGSKFKITERAINYINEELADFTRSWFEQRLQIDEFSNKLKALGAELSIKTEIEKAESRIDNIKGKFKLDSKEFINYQKISEELSIKETRRSQIEDELLAIGELDVEGNYFSSINLELIPSIRNFPIGLQQEIDPRIDQVKNELLNDVNAIVKKYKEKIIGESEKIKKEIKKILENNKKLIEKNRKNIELENLVKKTNDFKQRLIEINNIKSEKDKAQAQLKEMQKQIKKRIEKRKQNQSELKTSLEKVDQSTFDEINFSLEFKINDLDKERVVQKVNMKEATTFVQNHNLLLDRVRNSPNDFLENIYLGKQKINVGNEKVIVAREVLTLSEEILISAKMEEDTIGGISETTMTSGKRALFALRLILAESEDTWPLIIDQPEDDLDSRSIYDEIVPFLRKKKKERQIIMVSHNANLVIGSDSELIIVANRNGEDRKNLDRKQFNYLTGSIENSIFRDERCEDTLLAQGIREHACLILEGGKKAFEHRINKFHFS